MTTQTVSDEDLINLMGQQRRCQLCGIKGQDVIYGLKPALIIARRSAMAGKPASSIQIGREDTIVVDADQMHRLWRHLGLESD